MEIKGLIKAKTVDKYLHPIRLQIKDLVKPDSTVVEYGCGTGDLLFQLSDKLLSGIGIDKSVSLIHYARNRQTKTNSDNLQFKVSDLLKQNNNHSDVDFAIASLLFHVLPWSSAIDLLRNMIKNSSTAIVCGFSVPKTKSQKIQLWLDQRFSGHFQHYKLYQQKGGMNGLIERINSIDVVIHDTFDPVIKIYCISKKSS